MVSPEVVRRSQAGLADRAKAAVGSVWPRVARMPAGRVAGVMTDVLVAAGDRYGTAAGAIAVDFYGEQRAAAGAAGSFEASVAELPPVERFDILARWATGPLFGESPNPGLALSKMTGGLSRIVLGVGRATIEGAVAEDPAGPRWARHASANACAFCALVATRGAVYHSEKTAGQGAKYHDDCHCTVVPVFPGQRYEEAPYVAKWRRAYEASGTSVTADALAAMRSELGTN